jgi:hypothetical protein
MTLFRRFLVIQALLGWQGGFFFYAAVVVPLGTDLHGSMEQGRLTRHVTDWSNVIGAIAVAILAWDQLLNGEVRWCRVTRWGLWAVMAGGLPVLAYLHLKIEPFIDSTLDYETFYFRHRVYLYVATAQWAASLAYVFVMLRAWGAKAPAA